MFSLRSFSMRSVLASLAIVLAGPLHQSQAESPFTPLLKQVPPEANVLVLIDSEQIRRSPFAKEMAAAQGPELRTLISSTARKSRKS